MESEDEKKMRRKIAAVHRQMRAGGVQSPPILDRRTGKVRTFGPRERP